MSFSVRTDISANRTEQEEVFFWIRSNDEDGKVDQVFAKAAYSKARDLRFYRWKELSDQAIRANLVERAVFLASRSQRGSSVKDPEGYLFTVFARLVDRFISRERLLPQQRESDLDHQLHARTRFEPPISNNLDREILQDQILMAMPP